MEHQIVQKLSQEQQQRMEVIQELLAAKDPEEYRQRQQAAAKKLGLSLCSIRRLVRQWREKGVAGLSWRERRDRGEFRISKEWQEFILKTYREGNQGSRQMSPAQVAVRVKVRAQELGTEDYPSHMSVYRLLRSHNHLQVPTKRSLGWKGSRLIVKTREGIVSRSTSPQSSLAISR